MIYKCISKTSDPQKYGLITIELDRADGYLGWLKISGTEDDFRKMEVNKIYDIVVREQNETRSNINS